MNLPRTIYGDGTMIIPGTVNRQFPFGQFGHVPIPVLFMCLNEQHCQHVAEAMPIYGAMYVPAWAMVGGRRFNKVVVFRPPLYDTWSDSDKHRFQDMINRMRSYLMPQSEGIHFI